MDKWARRTFLVALVAALALFARTLSNYLLPVLLALMLVALAKPADDWLRARFPSRRHLAAMLSTLAAFLGVVVPIVLFVAFVTREIIVFVGRAQEFLTSGGAETLSTQMGALFDWLPARLAQALPQQPGEVLDRIVTALGRGAAGQVTAVASATGSVFINGFLTFVSTYYLFLDGDRLTARLDKLVPLDRRYTKELFVEFRNTVVAVFYSTSAVGIVQGLLIWVMFVIAGVPEAAVWAGLTVVAAFIPLLGSGLVWIPAALVLLATGQTWQGIFILAAGIFVVSSVDNVLRPLLVKGRVRVHPLVIFLSIFGGLSTFGAIGVVLGPVVASLTMVLLRIWERDFIGPRRTVRPRREEGALAALQRPPREAAKPLPVQASGKEGRVPM